MVARRAESSSRVVRLDSLELSSWIVSPSRIPTEVRPSLLKRQSFMVGRGLYRKSVAHKVSAPGGPVGVRKDAKWNVPEPELALVINSRKELVGFTIGNDMSSRDIEGENLLYLPQAKVYKHSCAIGPAIVVGASEQEARGWTISITIERAGKPVFNGETSVNQIKRTFAELIDYACRSQDFPHGLILLTGTGIVPGDEFTLQPSDVVTITISGVGTLRNTVVEV